MVVSYQAVSEIIKYSQKDDNNIISSFTYLLKLL